MTTNPTSFGMGLLQSTTSNAANGLISGLTGQLFDAWSARRNWKYQRKQMELEQKYALARMQQENEYRRQIFDYTNEYNDPKNVLARYQAAGINPAGLFGQSSVGALAASSPAGGGTGGSVGAGPAISGDHAPGIQPESAASAATAASQVRKNDAESDYYRQAAKNQREQSITEGEYRTYLTSLTDETTAQAYLLEQQGILARINAEFGTEKQEAELANLKASTDALIAGKNLSVEQTSLVKNQVTHELFKIALTHSSIKLNEEQASYVMALATDLNYKIEGALQDYTFEYKDPQSGKVSTVSVNGYAASEFIKCQGVISAMYRAYQDYVESDWANPRAWNGEILRYVDGIADAANTLLSFRKAGIAAKSLDEQTRHNKTIEQATANGQVIDAKWREFQKQRDLHRFQRENAWGSTYRDYRHTTGR